MENDRKSVWVRVCACVCVCVCACVSVRVRERDERQYCKGRPAPWPPQKIYSMCILIETLSVPNSHFPSDVWLWFRSYLPGLSAPLRKGLLNCERPPPPPLTQKLQGWRQAERIADGDLGDSWDGSLRRNSSPPVIFILIGFALESRSHRARSSR